MLKNVVPLFIIMKYTTNISNLSFYIYFKDPVTLESHLTGITLISHSIPQHGNLNHLSTIKWWQYKLSCDPLKILYKMLSPRIEYLFP